MLGTLPAHAWHVAGGAIRDAAGEPVQLRGVNWPGFEDGSPAYRYLAPQGLWDHSLTDMLDRMQALGINAVRLPWCPQTLTAPATGWISPTANPQLHGKNPLEVLDAVLAELDARGMLIVLSHHKPDCIDISPLWYTADYSEADWIADLRFVAERYRHLPHLLGIDLKNEPYGATWGTGDPATDWNLAAERAAAAVLDSAPDLLIFVGGIFENDYCSSAGGHFWGENLEPLACRPLAIAADKLVVSPHVYGPDVAWQSYFGSPDFPANMPAIWEQHFGRLTAQGYTLVIGEFGGRYAPASADRTWQDALVDWLLAKRLTSGFYWAWNPNNADTGGLLGDDWQTLNEGKVALLQRLWNDPPEPKPPPLPPSDLDVGDWCLDVDADGAVLADRDGSLLLRWLFDLRGPALTSDLTGPGARRTTPAAIDTYLADVASPVDIDADDRADALSDGVLALRWLAGRRGPELVAGALAPGARRTDPEAIHQVLVARALPTCSAYRFALAYGPHRQGSPDGPAPVREALAADMDRLAAHTDLVRIYSCRDSLEGIPALAVERGARLWQGVNLGTESAANDREIACLIDRAGRYDHLAAAVVGNEVLLRGELTEAQLIDHLLQARAADLPVTTAETWYQWCNPTAGVCRGRADLAGAVDFIVGHAHPYWEGLPVSQAAAAVIAEYITLRALYPALPVAIGETGWPSAGDANGNARPGVAEQRRFIEDLWRLSRRYGVPTMLFEAFDEPWKTAEGSIGPHWGLYEETLAPKHRKLDWRLPEPPRVPAAPMVTISRPTAEHPIETRLDCGLPVFGRAYPTGPGWTVSVEVFTDRWYPQPVWFPQGRAPVVDGLWALPQIALAGQDGYNSHRIRARLYNIQGEVVAATEIDGLVRSNPCSTP